MKIPGSLFSIALLLLMCNCKHAVKYDCSGYTPVYTKNVADTVDKSVETLLKNVCTNTGCHVGGDIDLSTYAGASAASKKKSFMGSVQHMPFYQKMPQGGGRLPDSQIHLLSCWIENGSPQ